MVVGGWDGGWRVGWRVRTELDKCMCILFGNRAIHSADTADTGRCISLTMSALMSTMLNTFGFNTHYGIEEGVKYIL